MAGTSVGGEVKGPRLEFVVKELQGTVKRHISFAPTEESEGKITTREVEVPAGYMVFTPAGHAYRLSAKELQRRKFDRQPTILNFEQANDTSTAAGRFKLARTDGERKKAYAEMEQEIIKRCLRHGGSLDFMISDYDPKGKVNVAGTA